MKPWLQILGTGRAGAKAAAPALVLAVVVVAPLVVPAVALANVMADPTATAPTFYVYHGVRRELRLDPTRVMVRVPGGPERGREAAAAAGLAVRRVEPTGIDAWTLLELESALASKADCAATVRALAASPLVDFASPVFHAERGGWIAVTRDVLVQLRDEPMPRRGTTPASLPPPLAALDAEIDGATPEFGGLPGAWVLHCTARDGFAVLALANRLAADSRVLWAEPDALFTGWHCYIPNDPGFAECWGIRNTGQDGGAVDMDMDGDLAWDVTTGDPQVKVLVLDDGVQRDHPDLNVAGGADFTGQGVGGNPVTACDGHGTAVAGCVAAVIDNGVGTVGIAPRCPVLGARVFATSSDCSSWWAQASWTVYGLAWGHIAGARVSNNSNGYGFWSNAIDAAYESTRRGGMVHFAASGNSGQQPLPYPASLPTVNAVAALHRNGQLADFTNFGPDIDFCAPGTEILTTDRTGSQGWVPGDHVTASGTSFASPYAAGVAALVIAQNSARTADQVELLLRQGCRDLGAPGFDPFYSWGFVNAYNSLTIGGGGELADVTRATPVHLALERGRPNPFAGVTTLRFDLAATGAAALDVADPRGRIVRRLVEGRLAAGPHGSSWDGRDDAGHRLPAGIYFVRLSAAGRTATQKVVLLRGTD